MSEVGNTKHRGTAVAIRKKLIVFRVLLQICLASLEMIPHAGFGYQNGQNLVVF